MKKNIKVAANMSAEIIHRGHVNFLNNVKNYFQDENYEVNLTVLLSTDSQIFNFKKRVPVIDYTSRREVLLACRYVDAVKEHPDIICPKLVDSFDYLFHGDDLLYWDKQHLEKGMHLFLQAKKLILIPYTYGISTTEIINKIKMSH